MMIYDNFELGRNLGRSEKLMKDMKKTPDRFYFGGKNAVVYMGPDGEPAIIRNAEFWELVEKQTNTLFEKGGPRPEEEAVKITSTELKPILPVKPYEPTEIQETGPIEIMDIGDTAKIAKQLTEIIDKCKLYSEINGRKYIHVEGWQALNAMLGVVAEVQPPIEGPDYFEVTCLINDGQGRIAGRGIARCYFDEAIKKRDGTLYSRWHGPDGKVDKMAVMSMAQTRAIGKANRNKYGWIIRLAGYEATPMEEMK